MWVGGTEANIAAAFKESKDDKAVLIIDEGDSFLRSREGAQRSYEVTSVNEMLSQMEGHDQPFILTTNLMDSLDPAALRRFTFKVKFDFMQKEQSQRLFSRYFGVSCGTALDSMELLTPGDFANIKNKVDILQVKDPTEIIRMLKSEIELKPQYSKKKFGF
jgi:SpoVK/Ycf46/Vps4 family AAA+-type ATPase